MAEPRVHEGELDAEGKRFALVVSRYNDFVGNRLVSGSKDCLIRHGADPEAIEIFKVPGSFEIPLTARRVAESGRFDAVVCLGAVIRGETPHFDFVAGQAARGVNQVSLETDVPVVFGVITTDTLEQAIDRAGARTGNRGAEATLAAVEMASLMDNI